MYVDNKVFITFIPLISLFVANGIKIYLGLKDKKKLVVSFVIGFILFLVSNNTSIRVLFLSEMIIIFCLLFTGVYLKKQKAFCFSA